MVLRLSCLASVAFTALSLSAPALAQQSQTSPTPTPPTPTPTSGTVSPGAAAKPAAQDDEVILKADQFEENRDTSVITASGNVEIRVGARSLKADKVVYDRANETVRAQGHVQITDDSGQVQFADEIEADQDFRNGFATRFSARMGQNGVVTASSAVRSDGTRNSLEQVIFTNCPICEEKGSDPTWALRARRATLDQNDQMISYQDAVLELGGLPVLYIPWFAHPDPNSERRSGLLIPDAGVSSRLGAFYEQPYLFVLSPSEDVVVAPMLSTNVNPLVKVDYRRRFFSGLIEAQGSFTHEQEFKSNGDKFGDDAWRSHLYAVGKFDISKEWQWGFGIESQTDDLYDLRYDIDGENELRGLIASQPRQLLTQLYTTIQQPDFYFEAGTFLFQGLRESDVDSQIPTVAPSLFTQKIFDLGEAGQIQRQRGRGGLVADLAEGLPVQAGEHRHRQQLGASSAGPVPFHHTCGRPQHGRTALGVDVDQAGIQVQQALQGALHRGGDVVELEVEEDIPQVLELPHQGRSLGAEQLEAQLVHPDFPPEPFSQPKGLFTAGNVEGDHQAVDGFQLFGHDGSTGPVHSLRMSFSFPQGLP